MVTTTSQCCGFARGDAETPFWVGRGRRRTPRPHLVRISLEAPEGLSSGPDGPRTAEQRPDQHSSHPIGPEALTARSTRSLASESLNLRFRLSAVTSKPVKPASGTGLRLNGSRPGEIGKALRTSLESARRDGRTLDPLVEALAKRMAGAADAAWRADNPGMFMTAATKLELLVRRLGLTTSLDAPAGGEDGDDDDERTSIDDELRELVSGGPTMGDAPNA